EFLGCPQVETRLISGQMANATVFSALMDYMNRADRKDAPRRIGPVMNHDLSQGGHLSAQAMGSLHDYVAWDQRTERPAIVNFPVLQDNPYKIDVPAALALIEQVRPELLILGKSVILHREPVSEIRRGIDAIGLDAVLMYDMAHVLGLVGPHFQQPFAEGADFVTGSTHKTFFGTQRGVIAGRFDQGHQKYELWETVKRRTFPGALSNHHLGTMLGLLMAAYEMNHFKDEYQPKVIANAKAFASALKRTGLDVAGDPEISFTETHQVVVRVGYGQGPEIARRLERNNIICNYQASPDEEGFTSSGALRLGVSEMTRWGMAAKDFETLAQLMHDVIANDANALDAVGTLREKFRQLKFCFRKDQYADVMQKLHETF
ncbi:MAG: glycine cleavage system protein T, partial [Planctomycetes bacterium]|nr:glycine cleavage system protein T [Planctomycetota bacterium]